MDPEINKLSERIGEHLEKTDTGNRRMLDRQNKLQRHLLFSVGDLFQFMSEIFQLAKMVYEQQKILIREVEDLKKNSLQKK